MRPAGEVARSLHEIGGARVVTNKRRVLATGMVPAAAGPASILASGTGPQVAIENSWKKGAEALGTRIIEQLPPPVPR